MRKKDIVITEKIFRRIPVSPLIVWGILLIVAQIVHFVWAWIKHTEPYFIAVLGIGFLTYLCVFAPGYVYDKIKELIPTFSILLDLQEKEIENWVEKIFFERIFDDKRMLLTGLILPIFILPGALLGGWFSNYNQDFYLKIFDISMGLLAGFTCSMSLFMGIPILNGYSRLGKLPIKTVSIFRLNEFATPISLTFVKGTFIVSVAYSLMLIIAISIAASGVIIFDLSFYFYAVVGILATIVPFTIAQIGLRNIIRKAKWQILEQLGNEIQKSMEKLSQDSSPENIKRVESLVDLHTKMQSLNETSLTWETITRLFGSAALPTIITLIEKLFRP